MARRESGGRRNGAPGRHRNRPARSDLAASIAAAETIIAATRKAGKPVCIMVADAAEAQGWRALGASAFIVASDQGFMRQAAAVARAAFSALPARQAARTSAGRLRRARAPGGGRGACAGSRSPGPPPARPLSPGRTASRSAAASGGASGSENP
jgi:hypothetical protein